MNEKGIRLDDKDIFTVNEVATILGLNRWTVCSYIYEGKLKASKLGDGTGKRGNKRRWRIWKKDLMAFVNRSSSLPHTPDKVLRNGEWVNVTPFPTVKNS
jgi:hypothetical protein